MTNLCVGSVGMLDGMVCRLLAYNHDACILCILVLLVILFYIYIKIDIDCSLSLSLVSLLTYTQHTHTQGAQQPHQASTMLRCTVSSSTRRLGARLSTALESKPQHSSIAREPRSQGARPRTQNTLRSLTHTRHVQPWASVSHATRGPTLMCHGHCCTLPRPRNRSTHLAT